jgi:alcohol dehydrogenase class IV
MAHTIGSFFGISHGLADAILLPYIIEFNRADETAARVYESFVMEIGSWDLVEVVRDLNSTLGIPRTFKEIMTTPDEYMAKLEAMADMASRDGCTKTNPVIPRTDEWVTLFKKVYNGN